MIETNLKNSGIAGVVELKGNFKKSLFRDAEKSVIKFVRQNKNVVLDISNLESIDASGISLFISWLKSAVDLGGDLRIVKPAAKLMMMFEITKMIKVFLFFDDIKSAIASFEQNNKYELLTQL